MADLTPEEFLKSNLRATSRQLSTRAEAAEKRARELEADLGWSRASVDAGDKLDESRCKRIAELEAELAAYRQLFGPLEGETGRERFKSGVRHCVRKARAAEHLESVLAKVREECQSYSTDPSGVHRDRIVRILNESDTGGSE